MIYYEKGVEEGKRKGKGEGKGGGDMKINEYATLSIT